MKRRLVILTEIISPYRIPLFNALTQARQIDLHVIFLSETDPSLRQWNVYKEEIGFSYEVLPSWRRRVGKFNVLLNARIGRALDAAAPDVILCGGYSYIASWQALLWARTHHVPFALWSESVARDLRRGHPLVEFLKQEFLEKCDGFVVPGVSAREYLLAHKIADRRIVTAKNAVDNDLFAAAAREARENAAGVRRELSLPGRYFLFVGRIVREKGVFELLSAYAKLDDQIRNQCGLVFVGNGVARLELENAAQAISPGNVIFAGFAQRERLGAYYGLADVFILPTYSDPWGLVVNEAMACGLPVIVSDVAGCAADLVREKWNGMLIPPRDTEVLSQSMAFLAARQNLLAEMGARSGQHISRYTPEEWSSGVIRAVAMMNNSND